MYSPSISSLLNTGNTFATVNNGLGNQAATSGQRSNLPDLKFRSEVSSGNGFELFNNILQKAYQRIADGTSQASVSQASAQKYESADKISANQASTTILNSISRQLQSDEANGASNDALLSRLDAGLEGFIKGFSAAKEQVEGMGLLTPATATEIEDTYDRVTNGIEQLRNSINNAENNLSSDEVSNLNRVDLAVDRSQSESFSLQLTTRDGDAVSIDISRQSYNEFSATGQASNLSSSFKFNQTDFSSSSFSLSVTGELDEGELTAIDQLLASVDGIATDFYQGNVDEAFEKMLDLEFDSSEFSRLDLNLQRTRMTNALAAYESTASNTADKSSTRALSANSELNQLLDNIENALAAAKTFKEPLKLLADAIQGIGSNYDSAKEVNSESRAEILAQLTNTLAQKYLET
jgi:hypothetical protein